MKLFNKYDIEKRTLYYWSKRYSSQLHQGQTYKELKMNEPTLKKAMDTLEFLSLDREARRLYEERQKYLHDEASMIE
ncbi:PD-(D/E)XK nuclease family transposase [compost metagenome]